MADNFGKQNTQIELDSTSSQSSDAELGEQANPDPKWKLRDGEVVNEDEEEEEEEDEASLDESSESEGSWISWFCALKGNEFFIEVDDRWIQDEFNLHGLPQYVPNYDLCLDMILDRGTSRRGQTSDSEMKTAARMNTAMHDDGTESPNELSEQQVETIEAGAELLYGLIHARFIITPRGLELMRDKYLQHHFGRCPRVYCEGQPVLPVGTSDLPRQSTLKLYCPRCQDIFYPKFSKHGQIDGAYFGTTFPHLLLQVFPELIPHPPRYTYVPRVFGFKIHSSSRQVLLKSVSSQNSVAPPAPSNTAQSINPKRNEVR
jgi:casein kinase II subunit beta